MPHLADQTQQTPAASAEATVVEAVAQAPVGDAVAADAAAAADADAAAAAAAAVPASEHAEDEEEEDEKSKLVTLADLSARGSSLYSHKNYEEAAEVFSRASNLQAELNGELAPENAEILFHYGRSLFRVGQSKSDVLGGQAAAAAGQPKAESKANGGGGGGNLEAVKEKPAQVSEKSDDEPKKSLFQFTGDENFAESDDEDAEGGQEVEEEEDDLATAFEILDLARVCYMKQLDQLNQAASNDKGKETVTEMSPAERHVKERLAETHDALAEISLESGRYPTAIEDGRISLKYKLELYPEESGIIAEAHYKLSLALEFASIIVSGDDGANAKRDEIDQTLRDEAVNEMSLAIKSYQLKLQAKEVELATSASPAVNEVLRKDAAEMKETIADMEQRLVDLRKDPIDPQELLGAPEANVLGGLFGAVLGETPEQTRARVAEATKGAFDLTSIARKKTKLGPESFASSSSNGKRKTEDEPLETGGESSPKKARVDDEP